MNKIFKVIWSKSRNCYVVASELAKGHTKASSTGDKTRRLALAAITALMLLPVGGFSYAADTATVTDTNNTQQTVYTENGADNTFVKKGSDNGNSLTIGASESTTYSTHQFVTGAQTTYDGLNGQVVTQATGDQSSISLKVGNAGDLTYDFQNYSEVTTTREGGTTFTYHYEDGAQTIDNSTTIKGNTVTTGSVDASNGVVDGTTQDGASVKRSNTVGQNLNALDTQFTTDKTSTALHVSKDGNLIVGTKENQTVKDMKIRGELTSGSISTGDITSSGDVTVKGKMAADGVTDETTKDGTYIKQNNTVGNNLVSLDKQVKANADAINEEALKRKYSVTNLEKADAAEAAAREAADTALDTRITNVKEYLEKQTSDNYVSKTDAAVQDGAIVKADKTIGENVTNLDAALAKETAARLGADAAQDKVIQQVNQNMVDGFNTINKNMADGFTALNQADANELAGRVAADTKLAEAINGGVSLSEDNVLQKNTTTIDAQGNVTTSKTDANEMILNKGQDNQITLNENGIKVGTNSSVMDANGVYTGGDTYSEAKAAMSADGSIKGADGKFTVNSANGTVNVNDQIELNGATGVVKSNGLNVGDGNMTVSNNGNINTVGTLSVADGNFKVNGNGGVSAAGGKTTLASDGSIKAADGKFTVNSNGGVKAADGKITLSSDGSVKAADGKFTVNSNGAVNAADGKFTVDSNGAVKAANGNTTIDSNGNLKTAGTLSAADGSFKVDSNGKITSTGLDAGNGTIQTTGTVQAGDVKTGTLETTGDATIGGNLTVDKNLTVNGEFNAKTLSSKLDENNYTTINGGKTQSVNLKMDTATGETKASASTFDETGSNMWAKDDDSIGKSTVTADGISQKLSDTGDNPKAYAESTMSQGTDNKYTMTDTVKDGDKTNVASQSAAESSNVITEGTGDSAKTSTFNQRVDEILNQINSSDTVFSKVDQKVDNITSEVTDGTNTTSSTQTTTDITNTAASGTITNEAQKLVNKASDTISNEATNDITNTSTNGNISNTANNGTISNTAKNIENTASENITNTAKNGSITNDAKNIANIASETLSNSAKNITNTTTDNMTNTIGKNLTTTVGGDMSTEVTGNQSNTVKGTLTETVTGKVTEDYKSDLDTKVGGNETHAVTGNQTVTVSKDRTVNVKGTETENFNAQVTNVKTNQTTSVGGNQTNIVAGNQQNTVSGSKTETVKGSVTEKYGSQATTVDGDQSTNVGGSQSNVVAGNQTNTISGSKTETVKGAVSETYGSQTTKVNGDQSTTVTGKQTNSITGDQVNTIGGNQTTTVTGDVTEDYKANLSTTVGGNQTTTVTGDSSLTAENITNEAKNKITNKAIDVETDASSSIVSKVSNEYGSNTSTQLSYQTTEEMSQADGKTASYLRGAAEEKSQLTDGTKKTTIDTIAGQTNTNITDGTNISNSLQKADQVASSVTDGTNTTVVNQDATSLASSITDGTKANNTNNTVDKSEQLIKASDTQYSATSKTATKMENALVSGSSVIDVIKNLDDAGNPTISSAVTDGTNTTGVTQTAKDITNTAKNGTIANDAKNITNTTTEDMTNTIGRNLTTTVGGDMSTEVTGNQSNTVEGTLTETVTGKTTENYNGGLETTIAGEEKHTVNGTQINNITGDQTNTIGGNQTTTVTGDSSLSAKNITNTATEKLSNSAADIENNASNSILNQVGDNTSWKMTDGQVVESIKGTDGQTNTTTTTADDTYQSVQNGNNVLAKRTSSTNDNLNITDGTNTYSKITTATSNKQTVTDGTETASTNLTKSSSNTYITNGTQTVTNHIAADTTNTVMNEGSNGSRQEQTASQILHRVTDGTDTSEVKQTASEVATSAKDITNTASEKITNQIGDGSAVKSEMTADGITNTAEGGTIYNKSKDILNEASGDILNFADGEIGNVATKITNITGDTTVTSDTNGTTFENKAHNTAIKEGTVTKTTISGNTLTTGQATMDYAEVMKDLGVHGNATVDQKLTVKGDSDLQGNANVGKNLTVNGTSDLKGDVTMESNATVKKDLVVEGKTTTNELVVNKGATVTGGTTTDTLHVTSTSTFDGAATFKDVVTMEKDLSVGGNATVAGSMTASSYKVGDKTYIDSNGINANNQKIVNVAAGDLSASSTDAVNGAQLYQTNERVASVENRVDTVENRVSNLDSRVDKVGANAAALANLHPLEFDADSKWNIAAAVGGYKGETATAIGAFYRPNENVMVNVSSSFGTGENMYGGGISLRIGQGGNKARRNATNGLTEREKAQQKQIDYLTSRLDALLSVINPNMSKDFPDVPENHWAYEAVSKLAGNGIIQGYEDGKYHGDRTMTRYEMAEIIYNALSKGAKAEKKLVEEFKPELQAMAAQKKA